MDTITHGIAGALIGKAIFRGDDLFSFQPMTKRRVITWSLMLGAIFPDIDTLREMFSSNELLIITWHRSITHSILCLPFFALALATLTKSICRRQKWEAPSFSALTGIYAIGIGSHIFLDLVTSFGTMVWSPWRWSRPAWDLIFILDFAFSASLLLPQFLAWVNTSPGRPHLRATGLLLISSGVTVAVAIFAARVGAPISAVTVFSILALLAACLLFPVLSGVGAGVSHAVWNGAGLLLAAVYIVGAMYAHGAAVERIKKFAAFEHLEVESIAALPFPPSLWHWDGLVETSRGVYELRMDLSRKPSIAETGAKDSGGEYSPLEYRFYPEASSNKYIAAARELPAVKKVLWFARFPVTRFRKQGAEAIVEFSDMRFPPLRPGHAASFTYEVRFDIAGRMISQGWAK